MLCSSKVIILNQLVNLLSLPKQAWALVWGEGELTCVSSPSGITLLPKCNFYSNFGTLSVIWNYL